MAQMGGSGAPGVGDGVPPPFAFVAKNAPVSWDAVLSFDVERLINGREATMEDLNALDEMARRLEEARIEPEQGLAPEESAARLARLATILQLSSEYQAMRAEVQHTQHADEKTAIHHPRWRKIFLAFFFGIFKRKGSFIHFYFGPRSFTKRRGW